MSRVPIWRAPRVAYCAQGRIWVMREQAECYTVNISESGLLVVTLVRCEPGTNVRIDLPFPGYSRPMPIPAVVVRETEVDGEYAIGVKFESMLAGSLEVLRGFIQSELASMRSSTELQVPFQEQPGAEAAIIPAAVDLPPEQSQPEPVAVEVEEPTVQAAALEPAATEEAVAEPAPQRPAPVIDLGELDEDLSVLPEPAEAPRHIDAETSEVPLDELDELGQRRPRTEVRRVKRRALERLRRKAAAIQPEAEPEARPHTSRGRLSGSRVDRPITQELKDIPEWVDGPRQVYDEEERELIQESEQDGQLKHLYRAAIAEVDEADGDKKKKKKKWF